MASLTWQILLRVAADKGERCRACELVDEVEVDFGGSQNRALGKLLKNLFLGPYVHWGVEVRYAGSARPAFLCLGDRQLRPGSPQCHGAPV